ncbi:MAG: UDP-N-acetylmuramoyl-tripeptide--D-alanyl-D-alanine ligase [Planctomycetota bacterium]
MVSIPDPGTSSWLTPAAIAQATSGRVARTGKAATRVVTNTDDIRGGELFVALKGARFDAHDFVPHALQRGAAGVVVQRVPESIRMAAGGRAASDGFVVRVEDTARALLDLAREHRRRHRARVIGITGSCGKTSTKDMLGFALGRAIETVASPKSFNNQVGVPLSLLDIEPSTRAAVIEIGTNAPGEIGLLARVAEPDVAVLTCVREAHLAGLRDLDGVAREKSAIFDGMRADGLAIVNGDDRACSGIASRLRVRTQTVRLERPSDWFATDVGFCGLGTSFRLNGERPVSLPRIGTHNVYNALFCIAAAHELGVDIDGVIDALAVLPHSARRLEPREVAGIRIIDDSYNMNPASARAALNAVQCVERGARRIVVFGEMRELGDRTDEFHVTLGHDVAAAQIDVLVTVGAVAARIGDGAREAGMAADRIHAVDDVHEAIGLLRGLVHGPQDGLPGDVVLCKASRAAALDMVVDGLIQDLGGTTVIGSAN